MHPTFDCMFVHGTDDWVVKACERIKCGSVSSITLAMRCRLDILYSAVGLALACYAYQSLSIIISSY